MPTTLLNSVLAALPERSTAVRGPDSIAVVCPMYNEAPGARRALRSLFAQSRLPEEIAISINGGTDDTHGVVTSTLRENGFARAAAGRVNDLPASLECWRRPGSGVTVLVLQYRQRTAKSEAINNLATSSLLRSDRVLLLDGDTILGRTFLEELSDHFYRLRWVRGRPVVEDYALQSGTVGSFVPPGASRVQRFIASARAAEYAFSALLRRGQVQVMGGSFLWGRTRLYTVVGCGFAARRDVFPMPSDTLTEDHDMTLVVQARGSTVERLSPAELDQRGMAVVKDGRAVPFSELFGPEEVVDVRHGGNARFVNEARMATLDPAQLRGYLAQIQRWDGGGLQNALKRAFGMPRARRMGPNARFALWSSQVENVLGLLLLFLLPVLLAIGIGSGGVPRLLSVLAWWLGIDLAATSAMTLGGFYLQYRGHGGSAFRALKRAFARTLQCWLPYMLLRAMNPIAYLAAASRVVPAFFLARRNARSGRGAEGGVAWERPTAGALDGRIVLAGGGLLASLTAVFAVMLFLGPGGSPAQRATIRLLLRTPHVAIAGHDKLPLSGDRGPGGGLGLAPIQVSVARVEMPAARTADGPKAALDRARRSAGGALVSATTGAAPADVPAARPPGLAAIAASVAAVASAAPSGSADTAPTHGAAPRHARARRVRKAATRSGTSASGPGGSASGSGGSPFTTGASVSGPGAASVSRARAASASASGGSGSGAVAPPSGSGASPAASAASAPSSAAASSSAPAPSAPAPSAPASPAPASPASSLSAYCRPAYLQRAGARQRRLPGSAARYHPLTAFELMMLGRLAPIEPYVDEAATAYAVPPGLLLQVLINESYLDPLAVGQTQDKGLSQVTSDALTLLRGISRDARSPFYNPHLVSGDFQVFDPDFSICAGAAKLAWARSQPVATTARKAYALYINPVDGLTRGGAVAQKEMRAVNDMQHLASLVGVLGSAYAAYRNDPHSVTVTERKLMRVSASVASGRIGLAEAYRRSRDVIAAAGIKDAKLYDAVLSRLYPTPQASPPAGAQAMAR